MNISQSTQRDESRGHCPTIFSCVIATVSSVDEFSSSLTILEPNENTVKPLQLVSPFRLILFFFPFFENDDPHYFFSGIRPLCHFCPLHRRFIASGFRVFICCKLRVSRVFYNTNAANAFRNIYCIRPRSKKKKKKKDRTTGNVVTARFSTFERIQLRSMLAWEFLLNFA